MDVLEVNIHTVEATLWQNDEKLVTRLRAIGCVKTPEDLKQFESTIKSGGTHTTAHAWWHSPAVGVSREPNLVVS